MGRSNRSRKRRDEMNKIKRERNSAKELVRLKKTLGLIDADGNEIMKEVKDIATIKTGKQLKIENAIKQNEIYKLELEEKFSKGEEVKVVHEKTGKEHSYNTKTMRDQHGTYPVWYNPRKTLKKQRKLEHARKQRFKQQWTTINVAL